MNKKGSVKDHFNEFAHSYSDRAFHSSLGLQHLSNIEEDFILTSIKDCKNKIYLDCGIGAGRNSKILLKKGAFVHGVDFSNQMLEQSKKNLSYYISNKRLFLHVGDLNKSLLFQNHMFDGVICIRVIKYVKNWQKLLREIQKKMKPSSVLILEISNIYSIQYISQFFNTYFTFYPSKIERELESLGFIIKSKKYGVVLPFHLYRFINSRKGLRLVLWIEKMIKKSGGRIVSRNVLYSCKLA